MDAAATDTSPLSSGEDYGSTMNYLKHSLLSRLLESNPSLYINIDHLSSHIQHRLPHLFPSIHIPSHLPYALMIENAIKGLGERNGSTEEAISDFIKEEYKDLPLAHMRILHVQLKKLCENGELVCKEGGRYVFVVDDVDVRVGGMSDDDGKGAEWKGGKKKKRGEKKINDGKKGRIMERVDDVERDKEQSRVSGLHDANDEPSRVVVESVQEQVEAEEDHLISEMVEVHGQAVKGMSDDGKGTEGNCSKKRKRGKKKSNDGKREKRGRMKRGDGVEKDNELQEAGVKEQSQVSELPDARDKVEEQGQAEKGVFEVVGKQSLSEHQETGVIEQHAEAPAQSEGKNSKLSQIQQDSVMHLETICSSQQTVPNFPVDSQQPLSVPISEGFPEGISAGIEHDENPLSGDPEQKPSKRPKGRPCKPELVAYQSKKLLQAEDQAQHCGQGRGKGRGKGRGRGRGRGQGRPPKLSHDTDQCEELLQQVVREAEAQSECQETGVIEQHVEAEAQAQSEGEKSQFSQIQQDSTMHLETICSSQQTVPNFPVDSQQPLLVPMLEGLPKGIPSAGIEQDENPLSGDPEQKTPKRPRGRPCKPYLTPYQRKKMLGAKDQAQHSGQGRGGGRGEGRGSGSGRGRGRPPKLSHDTDQREEQLQLEDRAQQHGRGRGRGSGRGRGRPPKLDQNANQYEELLQQEDRSQQHGSGRGRGGSKGRGRPRKLSHDTDQCEEKLQLEDRAQQHGRGRGRGSGRGRGRPPKLDQNANQYEELLQQEDRAQQHGSGRGRGGGKGRGRPRKLDQNANQSEEQLPPQDQATSLLELLPHVEQGRWQTCETLSMENALHSLSDANQILQQLRNHDLGQDMPPNPMLDANQGDQLRQPQERDDQPKRRGRPPKTKQD